MLSRELLAPAAHMPKYVRRVTVAVCGAACALLLAVGCGDDDDETHNADTSGGSAGSRAPISLKSMCSRSVVASLDRRLKL